MMWQRSFSDGVSVSVHAYAYASPCVVDLRTARDVAPCVTTVVLGEWLIAESETYRVTHLVANLGWVD